jgi:FdhD protein
MQKQLGCKIVYLIMTANSVKSVKLIKVQNADVVDTDDLLAIEEPLEIRIEYGVPSERTIKNLSVTMRTPGHDLDLAVGFLFTEGIINSKKDIKNVSHCFIACAENKQNVVLVSLNVGVVPYLQNTERNFYTTSSCGVCGKASVDAIRTVGAVEKHCNKDITVDSDTLYRLPDILQQQQEVFANTGGLHAAALFNLKAELLLLREDVGRHNALDKLIGAALHNNLLPLQQTILLLSGRASFELVQKAVMAGISIIAAVGAPSSLAVELATEFNITRVGFLRNRRFNIYTAAHRIIIPIYENTY